MNNEELDLLLRELFSYFEMEDSSEWPMCTVYAEGRPIRGVVDDELYSILIDLLRLYLEEEH